MENISLMGGLTIGHIYEVTFERWPIYSDSPAKVTAVKVAAASVGEAAEKAKRVVLDSEITAVKRIVEQVQW